MKRTISTLLIAMALVPYVAVAHPHLENVTPTDGSTVATAPERIMLKFSESTKLTALSIQRTGDKDRRKLRPLPKESAKSFQVVLPKLVPGSYTVKFRVYSNDSQVVPGTTRFTISPDAKSMDGKIMSVKGLEMRETKPSAVPIKK